MGNGEEAEIFFSFQQLKKKKLLWTYRRAEQSWAGKTKLNAGIKMSDSERCHVLSEGKDMSCQLNLAGNPQPHGD